MNCRPTLQSGPGLHYSVDIRIFLQCTNWVTFESEISSSSGPVTKQTDSSEQQTATMQTALPRRASRPSARYPSTVERTVPSITTVR